MFDSEKLLEDLGSPYTNRVVERLHRFAFIPQPIIESLSREALTETWGNNNFVLRKYLAVHIPWSIEQGRFTQSDNQFYTTAGHLRTRYGTPLYCVFQDNAHESQPWRLATAGSRVSAPELPEPPEIPKPPAIKVGAEVVMSHDHILGDQGDRVPYLSQTPPVAQICAVSGAIQWSIYRGLQLPYWYYGKMNYLVPLYLQNREDITTAPDLIAPVQVSEDSLLVRTVLEPHMPYANARVSVSRHDKLPPWLLASWAGYSATADEEALEDPEGVGEELG